MIILVTGAAGYIGTFFIKRLLAENTVKKVIGVDLLPKPKEINSKKLVWIQHDLAEDGWQEQALLGGKIDVVVHLAFKIRSPYGKEEETKENNLRASSNVFEFAFRNKIPKLLYSSSVAAYGAREENIGRLLKEDDRLKEDVSPYGLQKRLTEEMLQFAFAKFRPKTHVVVVRLNSVTGPIGQSLKSKFGLITFLKKLLPFVVETHPAWARQFVHENDVEKILWLLTSLKPKSGKFEVYNAAPPKFLTAKDISALLRKRIFKVPPSLIRPAFWFIWHITLGKIPTHPDSACGLIYPINVDGSKLQEIGFRYKFGPDEALLGKS